MAIGTQKIEDFVPVVKYNDGIYTALDFTTTGNMIVSGNLTVSGTTSIAGISLTDLTVTGNTTIGNAVTDTLAITGATTHTSTSASALTVGANGATNPVLKIDAATASVATGLSVTGAAAAGGLAVAVISSGTNEALTINAKGSGTIGIGSVSTGAVTITPATTITGLITATAGITSVADIILESATAVPATAGAVAAGAPITLYSTGIVIEVTSDVPTHTRPKGSICINTGGTTTNNRMYVNTDGAGTWTAFTTAA